MKTELRRIEAMLAQLAESHQEPLGAVPLPQPIAPLPSVPSLRPPSFDTLSAASAAPETLKVSAPPSSYRSPGLSVALKMPSLPSFEVSDSPQQTAKPALPVDVLNAIKDVALGWQNELQQCLCHIQAVYVEGPIVDGWLEAYGAGSHDGQSVRPVATAPISMTHDLDRSRQMGDRTSSASQPAAGLDIAGCRLCGFDDDGQLWFRHCPAEQVAAVSLAIARCERLKHLLTRKQHLEARLGKLANALTVVYGHLESWL